MEDASLQEDVEDVGILLVGCTGSGKSATGNMILDKNAFLIREGPDSTKRECHSDCTTINGCTLRVVDTPGFSKFNKRKKEMQQLVIDEITLALMQFPNGFHAVVPVYSYTGRLSEESNKVIQTIIKLFDPEAFKSHGVTVISGGDAFEEYYENQDINMAFKSWVKHLPEHHQWIRKGCDGRCVLFNNVTTNLEERERQRQNLMNFIGRLKNKQRYIPKICRWSAEEKDENFNNRIKVKKYLKAKDYLQSISRIFQTAIKNNATFDERTIFSVKEKVNTIIAIIDEKEGDTDMRLLSTITDLLKPRDLSSTFALSSLCHVVDKIQKHVYSEIKSTFYWYKLRSRVAVCFEPLTSWCDIM